MTINYELIEDITDFLFEGAVDPREIIDAVSKANDASEVHVKGSKDKKKSGRTAAENIAYATNAAGMAAGPAAVGMAINAARNNEGGITRAGLRRLISKPVAKETVKAQPQSEHLPANAKAEVTTKITKPTKFAGTKTGKKLVRAVDWLDSSKSKPAKIAAGVAGATAVGLQTANWAGDTIAANMLRNKNKEVKKNIKLVRTRKQKQAFTDEAPSKDIVTKSITWEGEFSKVDEDKKQVFGWCSLTKIDGEPVVDRQGDYIPLEEVEKSAYQYVVNSRKGGDMHKRDGELPIHASDMIESFVVTPDKLQQMGLEENALPHGWWVGFKVNNDNLWEEVKKGDKVHFSIHGKGKRVEKSLDEVMESA